MAKAKKKAKVKMSTHSVVGKFFYLLEKHRISGSEDEQKAYVEYSLFKGLGIKPPKNNKEK